MSEAVVSHTLYRFFDADGQLLYVGRTVAPSRRWREHERKASWYDAVASVTREVLPSAEALADAERTAIRTEGPLHNIAMNGKRRSVAPTPVRPGNISDTLFRRWASLLGPGEFEIRPVTDCEGDETVCDCANCHELRLAEFDDLRAMYDWHEDLSAEIDAVEGAYYRGAEIFDWYYDLFDVGIFARVRLVTESRTDPIPAWTEFSESVASAYCPFCFNEHRHFLSSGTSLDAPLEAPCEISSGGRYVLTEIADHDVALDRWAQRSIGRRKKKSA